MKTVQVRELALALLSTWGSYHSLRTMSWISSTFFCTKTRLSHFSLFILQFSWLRERERERPTPLPTGCACHPSKASTRANQWLFKIAVSVQLSIPNFLSFFYFRKLKAVFFSPIFCHLFCSCFNSVLPHTKKTIVSFLLGMYKVRIESSIQIDLDLLHLLVQQSSFTGC